MSFLQMDLVPMLWTRTGMLYRRHSRLPLPRPQRPHLRPLHVPQAPSSRHRRPRAPRAPPASTRPSLARRRALPVLRANTAPALLFPQPAAIVPRARSPLRARRCAANALPDTSSLWRGRAAACRARAVSSLWAPPPPATPCPPSSFAGAAAGGDVACTFPLHRLMLVCRARSSRDIFMRLSINAARERLRSQGVLQGRRRRRRCSSVTRGGE